MVPTKYIQYVPIMLKQEVSFSSYWDVQPEEFAKILQLRKVWIRFAASACEGKVYFRPRKKEFCVDIWVDLSFVETLSSAEGMDELVAQIQNKYGEA